MRKFRFDSFDFDLAAFMVAMVLICFCIIFGCVLAENNKQNFRLQMASKGYVNCAPENKSENWVPASSCPPVKK